MLYRLRQPQRRATLANSRRQFASQNSAQNWVKLRNANPAELIYNGAGLNWLRTNGAKITETKRRGGTTVAPRILL